MNSIEMKFQQRLNDAIEEMISYGYKPQIFITMCNEEGAVNASKDVINSEKITDGFTRLWELGKLKLSVENIIQEPEWHELFSDDDRKKSKKRLKDYGFEI